MFPLETFVYSVGFLGPGAKPKFGPLYTYELNANIYKMLLVNS